MSEKISALSRPGGRFLVCLLITFAAAVLACGVMIYNLPVDSTTGKTAGLARLRSAAAISDILGTIITISGVTAPLVVAYLLVKEREMQSFFVEKITEFLSIKGCDLVKCRAAYLLLGDNQTTGEPSSDLKTLHFLSNLLTDDEVGEGGREALKSIVVDKITRQKYYACFSEDQDKDWLKKCVSAIGIFAVCCFVDLYLRVFIDFNYVGDLIELFVIIMTLGSNIAAYAMILDFITAKGAVKRQAGTIIREKCTRVAPEIFLALREGERIKDQLRADLKDMLEGIRGQPWGDTVAK
ncbi:hypothetical protein [Methylobacterium sp. A54F]